MEEEVPEVVLSVEEDELVEDSARDDGVGADSEFRRALRQRFFAGLCAEQKMADR